jgi:hypothetical protein
MYTEMDLAHTDCGLDSHGFRVERCYLSLSTHHSRQGFDTFVPSHTRTRIISPHLRSYRLAHLETFPVHLVTKLGHTIRVLDLYELHVPVCCANEEQSGLWQDSIKERTFVAAPRVLQSRPRCLP